MSELELHKALIKEIKDRANDKYYDTKLIANAVYWILEKMADRKTEPINSEIPNNCEPQTDCGDFADRLAYERGVKHAWEVAQKVFNSTVTFYEAEDVAKQIDKDINVRSKDEPQTDCSWK